MLLRKLESSVCSGIERNFQSGGSHPPINIISGV